MKQSKNFISFLFLNLILNCFGSNVITLTRDNFEHETQASTGATTGNWLIKFYAPWCGHCKKLEPVWENVASTLKEDTENYVNVAKVDCHNNRELGTRFDIKGFPTIKMLSKGKVYSYKGKRDVESIVEFARGGFRYEDSSEVPGDLGFFGEFIIILKHAFDSAINDYNNGNYFTKDMLLISMPFIFLIATIIIALLPMDDHNPKLDKVGIRKKNDLAEPDSQDDD